MLLFDKNPLKAIQHLKKDLLEKNIQAYVLPQILVEVYYHICKDKGKQSADIILSRFLTKFNIIQVNLNKSLIMKAGLLKCQHHTTLSYNDCCAISYALNHRMSFYTTEKSLSEILPRLKIKAFNF